MENIIIFFEQHLDYLLLSLIIMTGLFVTKYTKKITIIKDAYKVLIVSIIISVVLYYIEGCSRDCLPKYLFTYFFATSFYELILRFFINRVSGFLKTKKKAGNHVANLSVGGELPPDDDEKN